MDSARRAVPSGGDLGSPIRVDDLCRELMLEYHADLEVLIKDVIVLLEQMQQEGLVKVIAD